MKSALVVYNFPFLNLSCENQERDESATSSKNLLVVTYLVCVVMYW